MHGEDVTILHRSAFPDSSSAQTCWSRSPDGGEKRREDVDGSTAARRVERPQFNVLGIAASGWITYPGHRDADAAIMRPPPVAKEGTSRPRIMIPLVGWGRTSRPSRLDRVGPG